MRRILLATLASAAVVTFAACTDDAPTNPTDSALGKRPPTQCLTQAQLDLSADIRSDIGDLFDRKTARTAEEKINNIERKLCKDQYDEALGMAFDFLGFIDGKFSQLSAGDPADVAEIASEVFALAGDPNATTDPFVIPPGAFEPTGGINMFDPSTATPENPIVAGTRNGEAAIVVDNPNAFPPGTGTVTIVLARAPGDLVVTPGAFIPGFQAYEEGYEILSSAQPSPTGGGVIVALCVVPPAPSNVVIGHLHETDVTLLVATVPDPESLGYIDCSDVDATTGEGPIISMDADRPWLNFAQRVLRPVGKLLAPPPLEATMLIAGRGLGGRTTSLSLNAPVDPTIDVGEDAQLTVATTASWSSDDTDVATVDGTGLVTGVGPGTATITADFAGGSLSTLVTVEGEGTEPPGDPGPPITFGSQRDGNNEVYVQGVDGAGPTNLTNNFAFDYAPTFSPDGTRIAFSSNRSEVFRIYTMNTDGTGLAGPFGANGAFWPSYSPDGSRIAYWSGTRIHTMDADGTNDVTLLTVTTSGQGAATLVDWSPDGAQIVTGIDGGEGGRDLIVIDADGTGSPTTLTSGFFDIYPAWSPDGEQISFARQIGNALEIHVMDSDGSNVVQLTQSGALTSYPNWSPDGTQIVFGSDQTESNQIWVMDSDGSNQAPLTDSGPDFDPEWQPESFDIE